MVIPPRRQHRAPESSRLLQWASIAARAWAVSIVPAMIILPIYIFPATLWRPVGSYSGRRLLELLWAVGVAAMLLAPTVRSSASALWGSLSRLTRTALTTLLLGALVSALLSSAPAYSLRGWALMVLLLVAAPPLAVVLAPVRPRTLEWLGATLLLYGVLVFPDPLLHGFANPRFQGQVVAVAAPPLLLSGNLILALTAGPAIAVGIVNGNRGMVLALLAITCVAGFLWPDRRRRLTTGLAGLVLAGALTGVLVLFGHGGEVEAAIERGARSSGRIPVWLDAVRIFLEAPLLGVGPELTARAPGVAGKLGHPHNTMLLIAAELGLVGLVSVGAILWRAIRAIPGADTDRRPWILALTSGGLHSLLSGTIIMPASQALLVLCLALALQEGERPERTFVVAGWGLLLAAAAAVVILGLTLSLPPAFGGHAPRFFQSGLIP